MNKFSAVFRVFEKHGRRRPVSRADLGLMHPARDWLWMLSCAMLCGIGIALWSFYMLEQASRQPSIVASSQAPFIDRTKLSQALSRYRAREDRFNALLDAAPASTLHPLVQQPVSTTTDLGSAVVPAP
jgi:hypothetical protein